MSSAMLSSFAHLNIQRLVRCTCTKRFGKFRYSTLSSEKTLTFLLTGSKPKALSAFKFRSTCGRNFRSILPLCLKALFIALCCLKSQLFFFILAYFEMMTPRSPVGRLHRHYRISLFLIALINFSSVISFLKKPEFALCLS